MNLSKLYLILFLFSAYNLNAQTKLSGKITNAQNLPISNANVLAVPANKTVKMKFTTTDDTGNYAIELIPNETYKLTFSHISYINLNKDFTAQTNASVLDIVLQESVNELEEIIITEKAPVTIKKDTTTYKVSAFSNGKERKLRELLKKLPGLEVDKEGSVTINGKKVTQLLVDGKQFFNGDTKLGVNNIPADVASEVEVIEDYHETSFLKGLKDSEEIAMNIKLKEEKKQFIFGDVEAGVGIKDRYKIHPKIFRYAPKLTLNFIGDLNNTIDKSFTLRDYINFEGGLDLNGDNSNLFTSSLSRLLINKDYFANMHKFAGFNSQYNPNENHQFKAFVIALNDNSDFRNSNTINYLEDDIDEVRTENQNTDTNLILGKIEHKYTPNINTVLKTEINIEGNNIDNTTQTQSTFLNNNDPFNTDLETASYKFTGNSTFNKKFNKNHVTTIESQLVISEQDNLENRISDTNIYSDNVPVIDDTAFNVFQNQDILNTFFNTDLTHYWVLNRKNHLNFLLGYLNENNDFITSDFQQLSSGSVNNFNGFNNNINSSRNRFYVGLNYKRILGNLIADASLKFESHNLKNDQLNSQNTLRNNNVIPELKLSWDINTKNELKFTYTKRYDYAAFNQYASGNILRGFGGVFVGNPNLDINSKETYRITYSYRKTYGFSMYTSLSYRKNSDIILNDFQLQDIYTLTSPLQFNASNDFFNSYIKLSYNKPYWQLKYNVRGNTIKINNLIDDNLTISNQNSISNTLEFSTKFEENPNIDFNLNYRYATNEIENLKNTQKTLSSEIILSYDIDDWKLNTGYEFTNFKNEASFSSQSNFDNLTTSIFYNKEDSLWSFELKLHNITNNKSNLSNGFGTTFINQTETVVFPRYVLFSVAYKL